jgi:Fe-S-cluster containining protein
MNDVIITDNTVNGKCSNCGQCCSNCLPLSDAEVRQIKSYIKKYKIKEQRHNVMVGVDMTCPFRDERNKKCLIYKIRPEICRSFMCNHSHSDIMKSKLDLHKINRVVFMRTEFFGNKEDSEFIATMVREMVGRW